MLDDVGLRVHLDDRVETLTLAEKHLLEIAKAFAIEPKLLVLDEPTAPLGGDAVDAAVPPGAGGRGPGHVRRLHHPPARRGARAGRPGHGAARRTRARHRGGRRHHRRRAAGADRRAGSWTRRSPPSMRRRTAHPTSSSTTSPARASRRCRASSTRGEIVGIAGVVGNGQSELMRALAGLEPSPEPSAWAARGWPGRTAAPRRLTCPPTGTPRV